MSHISTVLMPRVFHYGKDCFAKVGAEAAKYGNKALIVSDRIMQQLGYVEKCERFLIGSSIDSVSYVEVVTEPTDLYVSEALALFKREQCNVMISLGGGSCIDTAKAVAVLAANGGEISDYMGNQKMADKRPIPHIAIPTTAGTGSEVTDATVITNTKTDVKMMIKQPAFLP
jgi:alcohol dehydrogenase class IV